MSYDANDLKMQAIGNFQGYEPPKPQDADRLPTGKICADCLWFAKCKLLIQQPSFSVVCDWEPSRFVQKDESEETQQSDETYELKQQLDAARAEAAALRTTLIEKDARIVGIIDANGDSWRKAKDEAAALRERVASLLCDLTTERAKVDNMCVALSDIYSHTSDMGWIGFGDLLESTRIMLEETAKNE